MNVLDANSRHPRCVQVRAEQDLEGAELRLRNRQLPTPRGWPFRVRQAEASASTDRRAALGMRRRGATLAARAAAQAALLAVKSSTICSIAHNAASASPLALARRSARTALSMDSSAMRRWRADQMRG